MRQADAAPAARASCVALLGAPGTGSAQLAQALSAHFEALGWRVAVQADGDADLVLAELAPHEVAADHAARYRATLLAGLDLPLPAECTRCDAQLRAALARAGVAFDVVYGRGPQRLASALAALARRGIGVAPPAPQARTGWTWSCEKCSDPACEHRLFRKLLAP